MNTFPNPAQPAFPQKKKRGCLFYGCLTVFVLAILAVVGIYFGVRYFVSNVVENYSADTRLVLPTIQNSGINYPELENKVETFMHAVETGEGPKELILTADEVNVLINQNPKLGDLKNSIYVGMKDDRLTGQLSAPLDSFGFPGRYLNGEGEFGVKMENGILEVSVVSLRVKGLDVPQEVIKGFNQKNLAAKLYEDPKSLEIMKKIEQVKVGNGKLVVQRR